MNLHDVHWDGWQVVRLLMDEGYCQQFEIQNLDPACAERAALKVLCIPTDPNTVSRLLSQGKSPEQVKLQMRKRTDAAVMAYEQMAFLSQHPNVLSAERPVCEPAADGYGWRILIKTELCHSLSEVFPAGMQEEDVLALGTDVATALALCHSQGIVHESVKPDNVYVGKNGAWQLGDFGAAKASGMPCGGDMRCMAPEDYWGMGHDARSDVYALGILLYTMLNDGNLPLCSCGMTDADIQNANVRRLSGEALPALKTGSPVLQQLVLRACAYEPADRFTTAAELRAAILQLRGMDPAMPLLLMCDGLA